jgi:hypothetical protein
MNHFLRTVTIKHGQPRWLIEVTIGDRKRELLFGHPLAAADALVIAGTDRRDGVPAGRTLERLRMLAFDTLEASDEITRAEFEVLEAIAERRRLRHRESPR